MPLPSWSLCCLWHHRPQHLNHSRLILVVFMALFSSGSSLTYHPAPFMLNVITTSLPFILLLVVFPKALFSALYSSSCTLPLSVLLSLPFPSTTTFTFRWYSVLPLFPPTQLWLEHFSPSKRTLTHPFNKMTSNLLTLNSSKTEFLLTGLKTNLTKYTTLHLTLPYCSKPWLHLRRTSYILWPKYSSFQSLLLSYSSTSLCPALP